MPSVIITPDGTVSLNTILKSAKDAGLTLSSIVEHSVHVNSYDQKTLDNWVKQYLNNPCISVGQPKDIYKFFTRTVTGNVVTRGPLRPHATGRAWFTASELASIYNFPRPNPATKVVVGVISFGGGLYGSVDKDGLLTNGDCQDYWKSIGIPAANMPRIIVRTVDGAKNIPNANDGGATYENTLDIQTLGGVCPSANLTIILYIGPNTLSQFPKILNHALNTTVVCGGISYKPTILSISWGAPEKYFSLGDIRTANRHLAAANARGINICVATGDNGSNNGVGGTGVYADFPSSSPHVTAVGGTSLVCPNNVYDLMTIETGWSYGGGAVSVANAKPAYQSAIVASGRSTPDIALNADPNTGVLFTINKINQIFGGTSVAAPTFAGFLACVNASKFVNPLLYTAKPECFHDITSGSNGAYVAGWGHDNCTGLGSIDGFYLQGVTSRVLATNISMVPTLSLAVSQTSKPTITWMPANTSFQSVSWSSNKNNVATVKSGAIVAVGVGSAILTATTLDGSNKKASIIVSVAQGIPLARVAIQASKQVHVTKQIQLVPIFTPVNASNTDVTWSANNHNVLVSQTGLVTGLRSGKSIVTCTSTYGGQKADTAIDVIDPVASVQINLTQCSLNVGQKTQFVATCLPSSAFNKSVTWSSSNSSIVSVDQTGSIVALANGSATVTAKSNDSGVVADVSVVVSTRVVSITPSVKTLPLYKNQVVQLDATVLPANATDKTYTWTSANPSVATVSASGSVFAVGFGTTQFTVTANDGKMNATVDVSVTPRTVFT